MAGITTVTTEDSPTATTVLLNNRTDKSVSSLDDTSKSVKVLLNN
tara:strand:- start:5440 stop:5574 length:135 start_codon:yes stop_codon:yes gene_type:complete